MEFFLSMERELIVSTSFFNSQAGFVELLGLVLASRISRLSNSGDETRIVFDAREKEKSRVKP